MKIPLFLIKICMLSFLHKYKIIIPILVISILYNILWFSVFIYFLFHYPQFRVSLTLSFLLFYILIALPIKDWFLHSVFFKLLYPDTEEILVKDRRIKDLSNTSDIAHLLRTLVKELNINGLIMVTNEKTLNQSLYYRDPDKTRDTISTQDIDSIILYFKQSVRRSLHGLMTEDMKIIADKYDWGALVPIYYKSKFFGFLAVLNGIDLKKIIILEALAGRIGLILENEELTESAIKNESFKKEFTLARQIEKFLLIKDIIEIDNYHVSVDKNLLGGFSVSFPVLFEKSIRSAEEANPYFIFCRISKSNRRMRTMMLFMIAGYFLTHSKNSKSLHQLFVLLNSSLFDNGPEFAIDGFLMQYTLPEKWRISYFGKNVQIKSDGADIPLKNSASLGKSKDGHFISIDLKSKSEVILCINQIQGIRILRK